MLGKFMVISYYYTQIMWSLEFEDDNFNRKPYTNVYIMCKHSYNDVSNWSLKTSKLLQ